MDTELTAALDRGDVAAAIAFIEREDDPKRVVAMFHGGVRHLYWSRKDIANTVKLGRHAIDAALALGDELAADMLAYDVASFAWIGWDEPGIVLGPDEIRAGSEIAMQCLELTTSLQRDNAALARAHWLVGAHQLANGEAKNALTSFDRSAEHGRRHGDSGLEFLALGYRAIAERDASTLEAEVIRLEEVDEGTEHVEQLRTAARVFGL